MSFRSKRYDFVPCLNLLNVILPVPEVVLPSLSGRIFESEGITIAEFVGRIRARNNGGRTSEVRKSTISPRIVHSISNCNPDNRRFRIFPNRPAADSCLSEATQRHSKRTISHLSTRNPDWGSSRSIELREYVTEADSLPARSRHQCPL
jgi:hypothetical protein